MAVIRVALLGYMVMGGANDNIYCFGVSSTWVSIS